MNKLNPGAILVCGLLTTTFLSGCGGGEGAAHLSKAISVSVAPASARLPAGATSPQQFTATVSNDAANAGVNWTITGCTGGPSVCGSLSPASTASGVPTAYTSPPSVPSPPVLNITATSAADSTKSGFATIAITSPIAVSVSQSSALIAAHTTRQFSATVENDPLNRGVIWSLRGSGCNGAPCGRLNDPMANPVTYIAPDDMLNEVTETLTAAAVADNGASATVTITLEAPIVITTVIPASLTIALGDVRHFKAWLTDPINQGVTWSVTGCPAGISCGSFSPTGTLNGDLTLYTAPASVPHDIQATVTVTSVSDPTRSATAPLMISTTAQPISVSVSPPTASVPIGGLVSFSATVSNDSAASGVTWSLAGCTSGPCGIIGDEGATTATYGAPSAPHTAQPGNQATVTATSVEDDTKSVSALVTMTPAPINFTVRNFPVGNSPVAVVTADFNGDGKMDVAVADNGDLATGDNGGVSMLLGNGDGTFQAAAAFAAGKNPVSIAMGDFNGDGKIDLVVADLGDRPTGGNGALSLLLGNGDGTFQAPVSVVAGQKPFSLAVGDFNNDGKLDIAVSDFGDPSVSDNGAVYLLLGNGNGTFQPAVAVSAGENPVALLAKDFNADGNLDLAVADQDHPFTAPAHSGVSVLLGNGDGTFQSPSLFVIPAFPTSIAAGDLNGDRKPDLVVSSFISAFGFSGSALNVLLGDGSGQFVKSAFSTTRGSSGNQFPLSATIGDFDGDGKQDVAEIIGPSVIVLQGNGDGTFHGKFFNGTFQGRLIFGAGVNPFALAVGDFNGDGKPDIVVANHGSNDVSILLNISP